MSNCFVIQPFDSGPFDRRYDDVFVPAIEAAGLEAYRVDRDPSVTIPINEIESGIRGAVVCLADITLDNPNIWFELGYAIAARKEVVLVRSKKRSEKFPFDIQHRHIITYSTESSSDFEDLASKITDRLKAIIEKQEQLGKVMTQTLLADVEGLEQHEMAAIVSIAQNLESPTDEVANYRIKQDMEAAGFTRIASTIALTSLIRKEYIKDYEYKDLNNTYVTYKITNKGMDWLLDNRMRMQLIKSDNSQQQAYEPIDSNDLPF